MSSTRGSYHHASSFIAVLCLVVAERAIAGNERTCIVNTGGKCTNTSCDAWRGPTDCFGGKCKCQTGTCSGSDAVCHDSSTAPYEQVGGSQVYEIRNARWPLWYMHSTSSGAVEISMDERSNKAKFKVLKVPSAAGVKPSFLLYSVEWPDDVIYAVEASATLRQNGKPCEVQRHSIHGGFGNNDPEIKQLGLNLKIAPEPSPVDNRALVMFESLMYPAHHFWVYPPSGGDYSVGAYPNDPGAGGYWYFDPPLPLDFQASLAAYEGPRCAWLCGEAAWIDAAPGRHGPRAVMQVLLAVATAWWLETGRLG